MKVKHLKKIFILLVLLLFPMMIQAKAVESEVSSTSGIIKEFPIGRVSIENVGYTRYSNLMSSGIAGVTIKGAVYNSYSRDAQLHVLLKLYNKDKQVLQEFASDLLIPQNGTGSYQETIYANEIEYTLDDIQYYSLEAELNTDVEILEKGENDTYYLENYFVKVNVGENNVYHVEESFLATFRNKIVEIESGIPFRHVYVREDGTKVNKRAVIRDIEVDQYYKLSTEKGIRTLTIGQLDKTNTKRNYFIQYNYNVGKDILKNGDEFVFYLVSHYDVKIDGLSFEVTMPKSFDKDKIQFVDQNGIKIENVSYEVDGNTITGSIEGIINPQMAYAIRVDLEDHYFQHCTSNISTFMILSAVLPISFVVITLLLWFLEKKQRENVQYQGDFLFNKEINALELSYLYFGQVKDSAIATLFLNLANKGYIAIEMLKKGYKIIKKREYDGHDRLEKAFMKELFKEQDTLLRKDLSLSLSSMKELLGNYLSDEKRKKKIYSMPFFNHKLLYWMMILLILSVNTIHIFIEYQPSVIFINILLSAIGYGILLYGLFYKNNVMEKMIYTLIALVLIVIPIVLTSYQAFLVDVRSLVIYIVSILCMLVIFSVAHLMSNRTRYGKKMYTKIHAYKYYLVHSSDPLIEKELRKNPSLLYQVLPNAFVLGISDSMVDKFKDKKLKKPDWYIVKDFTLDAFYMDVKNIYSDIFIALKNSGSNQ